jgi:hypothetical protein
MGDKNNGSPYGIEFKIDDKSAKNITSDNTEMVGCNATYTDPYTGKKVYPCTCQDCQSSCPPKPQPQPKPKPVYILGIKAFYFVVGTCCFIWIIFFLILNVMEALCYSKCDINISGQNSDSIGSSLTSTPPQEKSTDNLYEDVHMPKNSFYVNIGIKAEETMQGFFKSWGTWCALIQKVSLGLLCL